MAILVKSLASGIVILLTATGSLGAPLFSEHDKQVDALLAQMTLDEKIGQMVQVDSSALKDNVADVQKYFLGSVLSGGASDPPAGNRRGTGWTSSRNSRTGAANAAENSADLRH